MKLKLDENGYVVLEDGKPVYIHDDGKEIPFDAKQAFDKIKDLNGENKKWREQFETTTAKLNEYGDLDVEEARKAIETIQNLDDKKLIDAGEIETVKKNLAASYDENLTAAKTSYESKIKEIQSELERQNQNIEDLLIKGAFEASPFVREKTYLTPDIAFQSFKQGLKIEYDRNGKPNVVGYVDGEKLFSRKDPGKLADPEEVIETLINTYPHKDTILKASSTGGSGGGPSGSGGFDDDDLKQQLQKAQETNNIGAMISLKRQLAERDGG